MGWFRRRPERDFRAEIESHLALEAEELARTGIAPADVQSAAARAFGNVGQAEERFYESQRLQWLDRLVRHVRFGVRALRLRPGFTVAAVLTLGFGIGINTAIFTLFYAVVHRPFPVYQADRVVNIYQEFHGRFSREVRGMTSLVSYPEFLDYAERRGVLEGLAVYSDDEMAWSETPSGKVRAELVSCGYFTTLGTRMALGRGFRPDECAYPGEAPVAVLSFSTWATTFGADSALVGRRVLINKQPLTVVGVAEKNFAGLGYQSTELWMPVTMHPVLAHGRDSILTRDASWLVMVGRLSPGATIDEARQMLSSVARERDERYPGRETHVLVSRGALLNFPEARTEGRLAAGLVFALGALVVIMACTNVMNLLLARGIARRREMGIRLALGASRNDLMQQLIVESLLLSGSGAVLGGLLSLNLPRLVRHIVPIAGLQVNLSPNLSVFLFILALSLLTALAFGLVPALQATRVDLVSAFKGNVMVQRNQVRPSRLRDTIVAVQVAGSAVILIVAGLFVRATIRQASVNPGYVTSSVVAFSLNLAQLGYDDTRNRSLYDQLRRQLLADPEVRAAALAERLPLLGRHSDQVELPRVQGSVASAHNVAINFVSGGYFDVLQIPLVQGRGFTDGEVPIHGERPSVVSVSMTKLFWPGDDPLGQRFTVGGESYVVTGVAANARNVSLADDQEPFAYLSVSTESSPDLRIVVRTAGETSGIERAMTTWARKLDGSLVVEAERLADRLELERKPARLTALVAGALGILALMLALVGISGVVGYGIVQRRREIAVRLALGSSQRRVTGLVIRQGARLAAIGAVAGLILAAGVSQLLRTILFGISPLDPLTYAATGGILMIAVGLAMYLPARGAAAIDPATTLRLDE
ncbi:MAG: ABC transporter permease [Gemmatimonadota bacterium]